MKVLIIRDVEQGADGIHDIIFPHQKEQWLKDYRAAIVRALELDDAEDKEYVDRKCLEMPNGRLVFIEAEVPDAEMNFTFIITTSNPTKGRVFTVKADSYEAAVQKMHAHLRAIEPEIWTSNWEDLDYDVKAGNQTCYEASVTAL